MSYYAVHIGKTPGIYKNWNDCKINVIGYKGAVYKKFENLTDAKKFIKYGKDYNKKKQNSKAVINKKINDKDFKDADKIFTDGSLIRKNKIVYSGYGIYIPSKNIKVSEILRGNKTNNRAEMTAIIEAVKIYKTGSYLNIYTDSNYSILIFSGTGERYKENNFKRGSKEVPNVDLIKEGLKLLKKYNIKFHHIRAHTNKKDFYSIGNDVADQLAVRGAVNDFLERNDDLSNYKMKIGKFKGKRLKNISDEYLVNLVLSQEFKELCSKNEICSIEKEIINHYLGYKN